MAAASTTPESLSAVYAPITGVERLEAYCVGGFYPVVIGDTIKSPKTTYRIVHKLGSGTFSTVWLAQDTARLRLVALKILAADEERLDKNSYELQINRHLAMLRQVAKTPTIGLRYMVALLDSFKTQSPNGTHTCLVTEPQGPHLLHLRGAQPGHAFDPANSRALVVQLVEALTYLHSAGILHGGTDLHLGNVLAHVPDFSEWTPEQVYERLGQPQMQRIQRIDGGSLQPHAPAMVVFTYDRQRMMPYCTHEIELRIVDFGESLPLLNAPPRTLHTALLVASPEVLLNVVEEIAFPADIWSLGVAIYEILGDQGRDLFNAIDTKVIAADAFSEIVGALKEMPGRWKTRAYSMNIFTRCSIDRRPIKDRLLDLRSHSQTGEERYSLGEVVEIGELLEKIMRWEPKERLTAREVLLWITQGMKK